MSSRPKIRGRLRGIVDQPWSTDPRELAPVLVAMLVVLVALVVMVGLARRLGIGAGDPWARTAVIVGCVVLAAHAVASFVRRRRRDRGQDRGLGPPP